MAIEIEAGDLSHQPFNIFVSTKNRADGRGDFARREPCGRDLIKKWLERVVVLTVDHRDPNARFAQPPRPVWPAGARPNPHYPDCGLGVLLCYVVHSARC